jgi:hypothetical protein
LELLRLRKEERDLAEAKRRRSEVLAAPIRAAYREYLQERSQAGRPTREQVMAERARRMAAGEHYGYPALGKHFHVSPTTIRRILGLTK